MNSLLSVSGEGDVVSTLFLAVVIMIVALILDYWYRNR